MKWIFFILLFNMFFNANLQAAEDFPLLEDESKGDEEETTYDNPYLVYFRNFTDVKYLKSLIEDINKELGFITAEIGELNKLRNSNNIMRCRYFKLRKDEEDLKLRLSQILVRIKEINLGLRGGNLPIYIEAQRGVDNQDGYQRSVKRKINCQKPA